MAEIGSENRWYGPIPPDPTNAKLSERELLLACLGEALESLLHQTETLPLGNISKVRAEMLSAAERDARSALAKWRASREATR